jgi:nitroreductase
MELMEAVAKRRSIRAYAPTPLAREVIERGARAAAQAPSGMGLQPRAFGVVTGTETLRAYSERARTHLLSILPPPMEGYREMLSNPEYNVFYGAPALVLIYGKPNGVTTTVDCALAAQNLMLAATEAGLGTCWIGFSEPFFDLPETKAEMGVPADYRVVAPIILGYPAAPAEPRPANTAEMVYWME